MDTSKLFLDAFGGDSPQGGQAVGQGRTLDERTAMFVSSFKSETELPKARRVDWVLNTVASRKLSTGELFQLQDHLDRGTQWADLPHWIREGNYVSPDKRTKQREAQLTEETGYTTTERQAIFNAFNAETAALAAMTKSELLRDSQVLNWELQKMFDRFGEGQVMDELKAIDPEAALFLTSKLKVQREEAKIIEAQQSEATSIREEIQAAQAAIEAMNQENNNAD